MKKGTIILIGIVLIIIVVLVVLKDKFKKPGRATIEDFKGAKAEAEVFKSNVNNPMNIRAKEKNNWKGKETKAGDPFESFDTLTNGIRAGIKTLQTYFNTHGLNTVRQIISRFAPETENDTAGYIQFVSKETQFMPDQKIKPTFENLYLLSAAIAKMENGYNLKKSDYETAWNSI